MRLVIARQPANAVYSITYRVSQLVVVRNRAANDCILSRQSDRTKVGTDFIFTIFTPSEAQ